MKDKIFYLLFFGTILSLSRLIPHPPNFTPILASAIIAPLLLKDRLLGMTIPIVAMFISDFIIGFHPYQFVVYLTILTIALIAPMQKKLRNSRNDGSWREYLVLCYNKLCRLDYMGLLPKNNWRLNNKLYFSNTIFQKYRN